MKTTVYLMNETERAERARVKALHQSVRAALHETAGRGGQDHRYALLAWAYVTGRPYRRIERSHHRQTLPDGTVFEHNLPEPLYLARALAPFLPEVAADLEAYSIRRGSPTALRLAAWIADPSGAIPAPSPRQKKAYLGEKRSSAASLPAAAE